MSIINRSWIIFMLLLLVNSFVKQNSILNLKVKYNSRLQDAVANEIIKDDLSLQLKLITFNILAPCYKSKADIICLQEFWTNNKELRELYQDRLGSIYDMRELRRTSYWRDREDGLAMFYNKDKFILQDVKDIRFHDCGDRVAQMLLLALRSNYTNCSLEKNLPDQQFLCVNTHLLFPHNKASTNIRVREMSKILDFIESYRRRDLCQGYFCNRSDVRIPVIVAGDFNGSPKGAVFGLMKANNFKCAQEIYWKNEIDEQFYAKSDDINNNAPKRYKWITHKTHRNQEIPVDHVFFCNPSDQVEAALPPLPSWTNLVFREVMQRVIDTLGTRDLKELFAAFDQDNSGHITQDEFTKSLYVFGFRGDGTAALTSEEIAELIATADVNGDGTIDYVEFCERFKRAFENMEDCEVDASQANKLLDSRSSASSSSGRAIASITKSQLKVKQSMKRKSRWLTQAQSSDKSRIDNLDDDDFSFNHGSGAIDDIGNMTLADLNQSSSLSHSKPMGDFEVLNVSLYPKLLENGIWPNNYTLSDHGIVEVLFKANLHK